MEQPKRSFKELRNSRTWIFTGMLISACLSLLAAFVLSVDAIELAKNPNADLACNVNSVISCGTVGATWQANLFGFPNAFLGLIAESVVITLAVAALGGVKFPRWFMVSAQGVYTLGLIFAYWLFYQSYFNIGALCPWCLLITLSTTLVFTSLTHYNILEGHLPMPNRLKEKAKNFVYNGFDMVVVLNIIVVLVILILVKYGPSLLS